MADSVLSKTLLFCDISRGYFVEARRSKQITQIPFGQLFSKDSITLEVYPVVINPGALPTQDPFNAVDVTGLALTFALFSSDGATTLATVSSFTADAALGTLTGQLNCDTGAMGTYVDADPKQILIEARFVSSTGARNVRASGVSTVIRKQYNTSGTPATIGNPTYPTLEEMKSLFMLRIGEPGEEKLWISPDGTKKKLQYCGDDDVMHFDEVT